MKNIELVVGVKLCKGESKRVGTFFNPATGEQSAEVK